MAQARALNTAEMEQVLAHVNAGRHAHRNRCFILLTHLAGMRVGEVASLRWVDVLTADGHIKEEIRLLPEMTKGKHARTVFISTRLREELQHYADIYRRAAPLECPLFYSQRMLAGALRQIRSHRPLPSFTGVLDWTAQPATVGDARS